MTDQRNRQPGAASAAPRRSGWVEQELPSSQTHNPGETANRPPVRQRRRPPESSDSAHSSDPGTKPPTASGGPSEHRSPAADGDRPQRQPGAYEIGYGRPPKHTRFKPGQSGNPKGRPKASKNIQTILEEELNAKIRVTANGRQTTMTKREALLKRMINDGIKGNARARAEVTRLDLQFSSETGTPSANDNAAAPEELPPEAEPILAYFERVFLEKAGLSPSAANQPEPSDHGQSPNGSSATSKCTRRAGDEEGAS